MGFNPPVIFLKGQRQRKLRDTERTHSEIMSVVLEIAESVKDENETLEECLFKSAWFVVNTLYWDYGGKLFDCGEAVKRHFQGTQYELAAIVFDHLCKRENGYVMGARAKERFSLINAHAKAEYMAAHKHKKARLLKEKAIAEYCRDKIQYRSKAEFAEMYKNNLTRSGEYEADTVPQIDTIKRWLIGL